MEEEKQHVKNVAVHLYANITNINQFAKNVEGLLFANMEYKKQVVKNVAY